VWSALGELARAERDLRWAARSAAAMGAVSFRLRALIQLARRRLAIGDDAGLREMIELMAPLARYDLSPYDRDNLARFSAEAGLTA
jgi:hypothetical protein